MVVVIHDYLRGLDLLAPRHVKDLLIRPAFLEELPDELALRFLDPLRPPPARRTTTAAAALRPPLDTTTAATAATATTLPILLLLHMQPGNAFFRQRD